MDVKLNRNSRLEELKNAERETRKYENCMHFL